MNSDKILEIIKQNIPSLQAVYLFGSAGTSYETSASDLDIAILAPYPLDPIKKWQLSKEIAYLIKRDVDIVDLRGASTILRFEILKSGKRIYSFDRITTDLFETAIFSEYIHFIEDRKDLLEDIRKRGGEILHG